MLGSTVRTLVVLAALGLASTLVRAEDESVRHEGRHAASWAADLGAQSLDARRKAVYALWHLDGAARPHVAALAVALGDDDEYVRVTAERVLGRFDWQRSINTLSGVLPELIEALGDERATVRFAAVKLIWAAGPQPNVVGGDPPPATLVPALLKALTDADAPVRANAAAALANLQGGASDAVGALTARLADEDVDVRMWSARALSWIDPQGTLSDVLALAGDEAAGVRTAVLEAAGSATGDGVAAALAALEAGVTDENLEVRRAAVNGLWALGRKEAVPTLERVLKEDPDSGVRAVAAQALGGIGDPAAVPALMAALERDDAATRTGAAGGLCALGPEGAAALPRLLELLGSPVASERASIAMSLALLAPWSAPALPALGKALGDEDPQVRALAASAISSLAGEGVHDEAVLQPLIAALADSEVMVLQYAVPAIANLGSPAAPAVPALLDLYARDPEGLGRFSILYAFQQIGPQAAGALPVLREAVATPGPDRLAAAAALARVAREPKDVDGAVQVLMDAMGDESTRAMALYRLKMVGGKARRAALALRIWMKNEAVWLQLAAASALLRIEGAEASDAVAVLEQALRGEAAVRALRQLAEIGPEGAALIPVLLDLAGEGEPTARVSAMGALRRMGASGEAVRAVYERARSDPQPWVRMAGARGLATLARGVAPGASGK